MKKFLLIMCALGISTNTWARSLDRVQYYRLSGDTEIKQISGLQDWVNNNFDDLEFEANLNGQNMSLYSEEADIQMQWLPPNQLAETARGLFANSNQDLSGSFGKCKFKNRQNGLVLEIPFKAGTTTQKPQVKLLLGRCP